MVTESCYVRSRRRIPCRFDFPETIWDISYRLRTGNLLSFYLRYINTTEEEQYFRIVYGIYCIRRELL